MSTLTGKKIANTYKDLLQISNSNAGVDGTLRTVEDGEGTNTPLQLSNSAVNINGPSALQLNGVTLTATASVLNAVADLTGANGMVAVSGGQVYGRTLVGNTGIVITNDKGTEGNPTFTIATSIATSADVSALETSIANSNTKIAIVSAFTSVNKAAITSINTVIDNLDYATSAELATVSALTSVNKAAITSINTVLDNLDYATSAELATVSSTLATSIANHLRLSGGTLTGQLVGTSATFSGAVCATSYYGDGSNLTGITASIPTSVSAYTVNQLTVVSGASFLGKVSGTSAVFTGNVSASSFYGDGSNLTGITVSLPTSVVTSAQFASVSSRITSVSNFAVNLSATFATSINNSNTVIAAVSALTSVNKAAITSINTVIDNLDYATSAELATVSALTSVNKAAITSINTVLDNLDYATSAELAAVSALTSVNAAAITSINTVIDNLDYATSAELAAVSALTSVNAAAITSINTVIDNLDYATSAELATVSSTLATSIANHLRLTGGTLTGQLIGTSATFSAVVSANEIDAIIGSFSTSVSVGANLNVVGAVSGTSGVFTGTVSANQFTAPTGSFSTNIATPRVSATGASAILTFATSGVDRMTITSAGNVGIGTTPDAGVRLDVRGGALQFLGTGGNTGQLLTDASSLTLKNVSNGAMLFGTNNTERMRIEAGGNVGIGTTAISSSTKLEVFGNSSEAHVGLRVNNVATDGFATLWLSSNTTNDGIIRGGSTAPAFTNQLAMLTGSAIPITFSTNNTERMRISAGGEVYIAGTTDQGPYNLQCNGTGVWGAGAYVNGSDARIKHNIAALASGLDVVKKLNPVTYQYVEEWSKDQTIQTGFIAQDLLEALAGQNYVDGVVHQNNEYMSVAYQNLIPILTKAMQEQQEIIESLKDRIAILEGK